MTPIRSASVPDAGVRRRAVAAASFNGTGLPLGVIVARVAAGGWYVLARWRVGGL